MRLQEVTIAKLKSDEQERLLDNGYILHTVQPDGQHAVFIKNLRCSELHMHQMEMERHLGNLVDEVTSLKNKVEEVANAVEGWKS